MNVTRLIFVTTFDYPTRYAHAVHGLQMSRAFSRRLSNDFLFVVNQVRNREELRDIKFHRIFGPLGRRIKKLRLRSVLLPLFFLPFLLFRPRWRGRKVAVFVNDPVLFLFAAFLKRSFGMPFIAECHSIPSSSARSALKRADLVVVLTEGIKRAILKSSPEMEIRLRVIPNAVDVSLFNSVPDDKAALRDELGLPRGKFLIGYIGRFAPLGEDKGLLRMLDALPSLPQNVHYIFVGGTRHEIEQYQQKVNARGQNERVLFIPHQDAAIVPRYAKACDALAYVPSGGTDFFDVETSPMKLFEYMAAGRPIIASDLPPVREILDSSLAYLISPREREEFIQAVETIISDPDAALMRGAAAREKVSHNTWDARAARMLQ